MSLNYCVHFLRSPENIDVVRKTFGPTLFSAENCPWLAANYSENPSDNVYETNISIIQELSEQARAEVVYISVDGMTEMFRYEHAANGVLLRKLLLLNNGLTAIWCAEEGAPEPWEDEIIFSGAALSRALSSGWIMCGVRQGDTERDEQEQSRFREEVRQIYHEKRFIIDDVWPLCDVEGLAFGIQKHYGMVLPPQRGWRADEPSTL